MQEAKIGLVINEVSRVKFEVNGLATVLANIGVITGIVLAIILFDLSRNGMF